MTEVPRVLFLSNGKGSVSFLLRRLYERFGSAPCRVESAALRPRSGVNGMLRDTLGTLHLDAGGYRPTRAADCAGRHFELVVTVGSSIDRGRIAELGLTVRNRSIHLGFDGIYAQHNNRVTRDFYLQITGEFLECVDSIDEALGSMHYTPTYSRRSGVLSACTVTDDGGLRRFDPDRDIGSICEAGFDALELTHSEMHPQHVDVYDLVAMKRIGKFARRRGLDLWAVNIADVSRLASSDERIRTLQVGHVKHALNLCELLGSRVVVLRERLDYGTEGIDRDAFKTSLDDIEAMADLVPAVLAFETGPRFDELRPEIESRASSAFGVAFDVGLSNMTHRGDINLVAASIGARIAAVHIGDNDGTEDSQALPGSGDVDWEQVADVIQRVKYRGDLIYKVRNTSPDLRTYLDKIAMAHQTYFGYFDRLTA